MNAGLILAAGKNPKMAQSVDRAFLSLGSKPLLAYSMLAFENCDDIDLVIVISRKDRLEASYAVAKMFGCAKVEKVIAGARTRQDSVALGLSELEFDMSIVAIHDACRPCITSEMITQTIKSAKRYGSGITGIKSLQAVKHVDKGQFVTKTLDHTKLWLVETPQSFKIELLRNGLETAREKKVLLNDDSQALELIQKEVRLVPSTTSNIIIQTADDLVLAEAVLRI